MADPSWQYINHPHRKPMPTHLAPQPSPPSSSQNNYSHSRSRTTSSNIFPINQNQSPSLPSTANSTMFSGTYTSRRTPSTNILSTPTSSTNPTRITSAEIRRSTSSRSGNAPTSYVALMRKQKATVWCDRAQAEDPRILAAQRAAKIRAANEVSSTSGRTSTLSSTGLSGNRVAAKIRHHGKAGLTGYAGQGDGNFGVGVGGVPMRLSASEVEGGDSDSDNEKHSTSYNPDLNHHRSGSGRSSLGSERRRTGLQYRKSGNSGNSGRWSNGNTPPSGGEGRNGSGLGMGLGPGGEAGGSLTDLAEETPMPATNARRRDYFSSSDGPSHSHPAVARSQTTTTVTSGGSGSSGERADGVSDLGNGRGGDAARLASNSLLQSTIDRNKSTRSGGSTGIDDLRRRGSVDERTMTITGGVGRLFVANPDLSDDE